MEGAAAGTYVKMLCDWRVQEKRDKCGYRGYGVEGGEERGTGEGEGAGVKRGREAGGSGGRRLCGAQDK